MASFCSDYLGHGVIVVASGGMDRHTSRLVDDHHIVVFVDHSDGLRRDRRLMPVECMADNIAILDLSFGR
jgi:hypothetical protein